MTAKEFFYLQPTKSSLSMEDIFKFAEEYHKFKLKENQEIVQSSIKTKWKPF